jgi:hypothetical protein
MATDPSGIPSNPNAGYPPSSSGNSGSGDNPGSSVGASGVTAGSAGLPSVTSIPSTGGPSGIDTPSPSTMGIPAGVTGVHPDNTDHGAGVFNHPSTNRATASIPAMKAIRAATSSVRASRATKAVSRASRGARASAPASLKSLPEQPR